MTGNLDPNLIRNVYRQLNRKRTTEHVDKVRARMAEEAGATEPSESPTETETT